MKVVIAIDSLKGSLSSMEAGTAIKDGILAAKPDAEVIVKRRWRRRNNRRTDRRNERGTH